MKNFEWISSNALCCLDYICPGILVMLWVKYAYSMVA